MRVIYVAGRFRGKTQWDIAQNVRHAEREALKLWKKGWFVICPHLNTQNFQGCCPDETFLRGNLEILSRCDAIYMLSGWESSEGAQAEIRQANHRNLEIHYEEWYAIYC